MVISHKHKFIFICVSKTGSTSISSALDKYNEVNVPKHTQLRDVCKYTNIDLKKYFIAAIARNPYDRVVSMYYQYKRKKYTEWKQLKKRKWRKKLCEECNAKPFSQFVERFVSHGDLHHKKFAKSCDPVIDYITDRSSNIGTSYIGQFDELQESFNTICKQVGIKCRCLPNLNVTQDRETYIDYYNDDTKHIVSTQYSRDFEYFNYKF